MFKLAWDAIGERRYETGVDRGVLYPAVNGTYPEGVAWDGLIGVSESPSGAEPTALWADNMKYLSIMSAEEFGLTIEAYMYPEEFGACDGSAEIATGVTLGQQKRAKFGFSYRTLVGNDTNDTEYGYKIHLVYGCLASPSERSHQTVNESPEAETMSWEVSTTPVAVEGFKPVAHIVIDSTKANAEELAALEAKLYGTAGASGTEASLPLPADLKEIFKTSLVEG